MTRHSFVYGALVLLVASLFNRIVGFIYQIMMIRMIRPEGVGLFNMIYPIYVLVLVVATAGIPVAIAKLVAEEVAKNNLRGAYRIFKISLAFIAFSGIFFTILLLVGSPLLHKYIFPNPKVYYCFLSLVPGVLIVSLCSAFRGFFQGLQQMTPTAVTQTVEQLVRVTAGLGIAYFMLPRGIEYAAVGISLGVICGEFTGFVTMLGIYLRKRPRIVGQPMISGERFVSLIGRIFNLAIPVTMTRFVATALMSLDAVLIPRRLQEAGLTINEATACYGQLVGIAETLLFTPGIITISLATALIPAISDALAQKNFFLVRTRTEEALRLTIVTGLPTAVIFLLLPRELCGMLFGYPEAGVPLSILAVGGPFLYLQQTTTGILQGLGKASIPFKNLLIASVFKISGIYYLTGLQQMGIKGTALSLSAFFIIMSLLNYRDLQILSGIEMELGSTLLKPLLASIGMALVLWQTKAFILLLTTNLILATLGSLFCSCVSYLILLFIFGGIHNNDIQRIRNLIKIRN